VAEELSPEQLVEYKELLLANTIQIDTMYQILLQKELFTEAEFLEKMKMVRQAYQRG
jgi:hypothetical protein